MYVAIAFSFLLLISMTGTVYAQTSNSTTNPLAKAIISGLGLDQKCPGNTPGGKSAILGPLGIGYTGFNVTSGKCNICFVHGVGFGILMQKLMDLKVKQIMKMHGIQNLTTTAENNDYRKQGIL
jgi:hypothetical protein